MSMTKIFVAGFGKTITPDKIKPFSKNLFDELNPVEKKESLTPYTSMPCTSREFACVGHTHCEQ